MDSDRRPEGSDSAGQEDAEEPEAQEALRLVNVHELRDRQSEGSDSESTCLRPLGLCELGGSCDVCWYRPDHPRFKQK